MSQRSSIGSSELLRREQLDLVSACEDLRNTFRDYVQYIIVLWEHGDWTFPEDDAARRNFIEHSSRLAPLVAGAEIVGLEVAPFQRSPQLLERQFEIANAYFAGHEVLREPSVPSLMMLRMFSIAKALRNNGEHIPRFIPLGVYDSRKAEALIDGVHTAVDITAPYIEQRRVASRIDALSEEVVVRQLHALGQSVPIDGNLHKIADVRGADHSTVAIALRTLGANVRAIRLHPIAMGPNLYFERLLRFSGISTDEAEKLAPLYKEADVYGFDVWMKALEKQKLTPMNTGSISELQELRELGILYVRARTGSLHPKLHQEWEALMQHRPKDHEYREWDTWLDSILALARLACRF